jgi:DNA-binding MarR family transcriptional regulator
MQVTTDGTTAPGRGAGIADDVSPLAEDLYALVVYLHKNCNHDLFETVGELELTLTQIKLLHHLENPDHMLTLKEAAELVHISLPAASRTVDDLVRRGYVERQEDLDDRRMKRVSVTDSGRAVIHRLNAARLTGLEQFVAGLNESERATLGGALGELLSRPDVAACRLEGLDR